MLTVDGRAVRRSGLAIWLTMCLLLLLVGAILPEEAHGQCVAGHRVAWPPIIVGPDETFVRGTVLDEPVSGTPGPGRATGRVFVHGDGYRVRVASVAGAESQRSSPGDTIIVFSWTAGSESHDCNPAPAVDSLEVGTTHYFRLVPRPEQRWVENLPSYDRFPKPLGLYPGTLHDWESLPPDRYVELVSMLPREDEWAEDCIPSVRRITRWRREHPGKVARSYPARVVSEELHEGCNQYRRERAAELERFEATRPVPAGVEVLLSSAGCRRDPALDGEPIDGRFDANGSRRWVAICGETEGWRLLLLDSGNRPAIRELMSLPGSPGNWFLTVAPAAYLYWMTADELFGRPAVRVDAPEHEVIVMTYLGGYSEDWTFALYETAEGWTSVGARCCDWPERVEIADLYPHLRRDSVPGAQ